MPRDVYPHPNDRFAIEAFLAGSPKSVQTDFTVYDPNQRRLTLTLGGGVAWFDTGGALMVMIPNMSFSTGTVVLAVNYVCEVLGVSERVQRDVETWVAPATHSAQRVKYFLGGRPLEPGVPTELLGPLGVQAWRASNNRVQPTI